MSLLLDENGNPLSNEDAAPVVDDYGRPLSPVQGGGPTDGAPPMGTAGGAIPELEGSPSNLGGSNDSAEGMIASDLVHQQVAPYLPNPTQGVGGTLVPSYENYAGPGKKTWKDAYETKPGEIERAVMEGAEAEGQMGQAKADWYRDRQQKEQEELAVLTRNRNERADMVEAQQKHLEAVTQKYSNDLSDRGGFWENPGRIMASFGVALMALGGADPNASLKVVNDAINADFMRRKSLADMHLGELRSNVGQYRALMGDKDLGDRMAYMESKRVAAMELERIGAQFQGPLAKAKAATAVKSLLRDVDVESMKLRLALGVHKEASFQDPRVAKELEAQGKAMPPGEGPTPYKGSWKPGTFPTGTGNKDSFSGSGRAGSEGSASVPLIQMPSEVTRSAGALTPEQSKFLESRVPGSSQAIASTRMTVMRHLLAKAHADPYTYQNGMTAAQVSAKLLPKQRAAFNEANAAYQNELDQDNDKIGQAVLPIAGRISAYRILGKHIGILEMTANQLSKQTGTEVTPDMLLETRYKQFFGAGNMKRMTEWLAAGDRPTEAHAVQARNLQAALNDFQQIMSGNISAWVQKTSGGTVSEGEKERNKQFVDATHSWDSLKGFQRFVSQGAQAEAKAAIGRARSNLTRLSWQAYIGMEDPTVSFHGVKGYDKKAARASAADKLSSGGQSVKPGAQSRMDYSQGNSPQDMGSYDPSLMSQQPTLSPEVLKQATDGLKRKWPKVDSSWLKTP